MGAAWWATHRKTTAGKVLAFLLWVALGELALLAITGVFLLFFYQPSPEPAVSLIHRPATDWVRAVHAVTAQVMVVTLVAAAIGAVAAAAERRSAAGSRGRHVRVARAVAAGVALMFTGLFGSFTGQLLPWDQLSLVAVVVGTNVEGYRFLWYHLGVQYALVGHSAVSPDTIGTWLVIHVLVVPAALGTIGSLIAWQARLLAPSPGGSRGDEP